MDSKFGSGNQTKEKPRIIGLTDLTAKQKRSRHWRFFCNKNTKKKGLEAFKDQKFSEATANNTNGLKSNLCRARLAIHNT